MQNVQCKLVVVGGGGWGLTVNLAIEMNYIVPKTAPWCTIFNSFIMHSVLNKGAIPKNMNICYNILKF